MRDTTREAAEVYYDLLRTGTDAERWQRFVAVNDLNQSLAEAGVRQRHPDYSDDDVHAALLHHRLGSALYREAYPDAPVRRL